MKNIIRFVRDLEIDTVTILGGFIILCMTCVVVCGIVTLCTM